MQESERLTVIEEPYLTARHIFSCIAAELDLVEAEFERQARSDIPIISFLTEYLRAAGGKRLRPALLLLSDYAVGGEAAQHNAIRMAAVMEFLHTATIVHDDIIDNAELRRNQPSVNNRFGNQRAVLIGDWLYMSAFETSLAERSLQILDILTAVTRKMTEGELIQLTLLGRADLTEAEYFDILRRKTAYLFSACCEIGAMLGGAGIVHQAALREYGMNLGTAFQLIDDLLDFTATDEALGKPAGVDLVEGKLTLPLIYLLEKDGSKRAAAQTVMNEASYEKMPRSLLLRAAEQTGALERARLRAKGFAEAAKNSLDCLPASKYLDALRSIPNYILEREC